MIVISVGWLVPKGLASHLRRSLLTLGCDIADRAPPACWWLDLDDQTADHLAQALLDDTGAPTSADPHEMLRWRCCSPTAPRRSAVAAVIFMDQASRRRAHAALGEQAYARIEACLDIYLVITGTGHVLTCVHRDRGLRVKHTYR